MRKLEQKKKLNNGGFSLVELIIVIAIMVVLVGILAPTYLKYVEKSRVSADAATLDEFVSVMQAVASDTDITLDASKSYTVSNSGATVTVSADLQTILTSNGLMTATDISSAKLKSTTYTGASCVITLSYDTTNKVWQVAKTGFPTT